MNYSDLGGNRSSFDNINYSLPHHKGEAHGQPGDRDALPNRADQRVRELKVQEPYQSGDSSNPEFGDHFTDAFWKQKSRSVSDVSGATGVHRQKGRTAWAHSVAKGLHRRDEGSRIEDYSENPGVEDLHNETVKDVARGKYRDLERQTGNRHHSEGAYTDLVQSRAGLTRKGQPAKAHKDNTRDSNTNVDNPNDCDGGGY